MVAFASKLERMGISTLGISSYFFWIIMGGTALGISVFFIIMLMRDKGSVFRVVSYPVIYSCKMMWYLLLLPLVRLILPMLVLLAVVFVFSLIPIPIISTILAFVAVLGMFFVKGFTDQLIDKIPVNDKIIKGRFLIIILIFIANIWLMCGKSLPFLDTFV